MTGSKLAGGIIGATAFLACPCHLAITLPLAIGLLGGSAIGAFLAANTSLVVGVAMVWFLVGLGLAWWLLSSSSRVEAARRLPETREGSPGSSSRQTIGGAESRLGHS